jgi:hypothetical protein
MTADRRTRAERETVIRFDETDDLAFLSTFSAIQARRWERAGVQLTQRGGEWLGRAPKQAIWGCRPVNPDGTIKARTLTDEQREAARQQMANLRRPARIRNGPGEETPTGNT